VRLVGPPSAELTVVNKSLTSGVSKGVVAPLFLEEIYPAVWMLAEAHGIDPLGAIAQSAIETGWGKYTGVVKPPFHNTAGLKVSPEQQALFPGTTDGLSGNWAPSATYGQNIVTMAQRIKAGL
jgi:flagellum-specific peptidoglycan hydrolase FlgJ